MIKWDGYNKCQQVALSVLELDEHGASLDFQLLPFDDGTVPSKQAPPPPPPPPPNAAPPPDQLHLWRWSIWAISKLPAKPRGRWTCSPSFLSFRR